MAEKRKEGTHLVRRSGLSAAQPGRKVLGKSGQVDFLSMRL